VPDNFRGPNQADSSLITITIARELLGGAWELKSKYQEGPLWLSGAKRTRSLFHGTAALPLVMRRKCQGTPDSGPNFPRFLSSARWKKST